MSGTVKKLGLAEGVAVANPTELEFNPSTAALRAYADEAAWVTANGTASDGAAFIDTTTRKFRYYVNSVWRNGIPESDSADPTKKLLINLTGNTTDRVATLTFACSGNRTFTFPDATTTVVGHNATQVLTNKDYDGGTASDTSRMTIPKAPTSTLSGLTRKQATIVYDTTLNKPYYDNGSALVAFGTGTGTGGVNYITNSDIEDDATGYSTYDDGASATPVDGTGGSPTAVTVARNTTTPLKGNGDLKISKSAADGQGEGVAVTATVPRGYQYGQKSQIRFLWDGSHANYVAGDMVCYIYDVTNSTLITPTVTALPKAKTAINIAFDQSATGASYRLIFHVATTNASAYDVYADDILVGPGSPGQSLAGGEPVNYGVNTFSYSGGGGSKGTTAEDSVTITRYGRWAEIHIEYRQTVAGSNGTGDLNWELPSGLTIDTSVPGYAIAAGRRDSHVGAGWAAFGSPTNTPVSPNIIGTNKVQFVYRLASSLDDDRITTFFSISSATLSVNMRLPIAEWAGSSFTGQNDVEYVSHDGTSIVNGPAGAAIPTTTPAGTSDAYIITSGFQSRQTTDTYLLEIQVGGGSNPWMPVGDTNIESLQYDGTNFIGANVRVNGSDIEIIRGKYRRQAGSTAGTWSGIVAGTRWRIKKFSQGQVTGFGESTASSLGLNKKNRLQKKTLSGNITTTTSNVITFSGLTVGRTYRLTMNVQAQSGNSGVNNAYLTAVHNSTNLVYAGVRNIQVSIVGSVHTTGHVTFTAATTSLAINATVSGVGSQISGATDETNVVLEELNDTEVTTAFT